MAGPFCGRMRRKMTASSAGVECPQGKAFWMIVRSIVEVGSKYGGTSSIIWHAHRVVQSTVSSQLFCYLLSVEDWGRKG